MDSHTIVGIEGVYTLDAFEHSVRGKTSQFIMQASYMSTGREWKGQRTVGKQNGIRI